MDEGGAPPRFGPPPPPLFCQERTARSPPPSRQRLSLLGDKLCLQGHKQTQTLCLSVFNLSSLPRWRRPEPSMVQTNGHTDTQVNLCNIDVSVKEKLTGAGAACTVALQSHRRCGCRNRRWR